MRGIGQHLPGDEPWFDYGKALDFLESRGYNLEEVREGSQLIDLNIA
jgi:hypothetical protein